jgi:hypothetical protein
MDIGRFTIRHTTRWETLMPFKSKKQEAYLKINEPKVYKKWKKNYNMGGMNCPVDGEAIRGKTKIRMKGR